MMTNKKANSTMRLAGLVTVVLFASSCMGAARYASGCLMMMGAGLSGTAYVNSTLNNDKKIDSTGYASSGVLGCLAGWAYVGITGETAGKKVEYRLKKENEALGYELRRASKEKCLLSGTCTAESDAIIVEKPHKSKKMGDSVYRGRISTIEVND